MDIKKKPYHESRWTYDIRTGKIVRKEKTINTNTPKAIIYVRVSDQKQVTQGYGIEWQTTTCLNFCESKWRDVMHIFKDEAISWGELNRKWLNEAIQYLKEANKSNSNISYFVVTELSRLSRSDDIGATFATHNWIEWLWCKIIATMNPSFQNDENSDLIQDMNYIFAKNERRKIKYRTRNGMKSRLLSWNRPFSIPSWYERVHIKEGNKTVSRIIRKDPEARIIKETLEMFANNILINQKDVVDHLNEANFTSNFHSPKPWKLRSSFAERLLSLEKLLFYSWRVLYPKYGIDEPIQGNREPLITIETAHKILERLGLKWTTKPRKDTWDRYFLKWILYCPNYEKPYYTWPATGKLWVTYYYYYLRWDEINKEDRVWLQTDKIHNELRETIDKFSLKNSITKILNKAFDSVFWEKKKLHEELNREKKRKIIELENRIEKISEKYYNCQNNALSRKMENELWVLENEKELLLANVDKEFLSEVEFEKLLDQYIQIMKKPSSIWDLWSREAKQLLIRVLFWNKLYYKKNEGFQTPHKSLTYTISDHINGTDFRLGRSTGIEPAARGTTNLCSTTELRPPWKTVHTM